MEPGSSINTSEENLQPIEPLKQNKVSIHVVDILGKIQTDNLINNYSDTKEAWAVYFSWTKDKDLCSMYGTYNIILELICFISNHISSL